MGFCCSKIYSIDEKAKYFYKKTDEIDTNKQVKLEPRLLNIKQNLTCRIKLIIFTNEEKTSFKEGGTTEEEKTDEKTGIISFSKFFVMEYLFEKVQPIEFVITGDIEAEIQTNLPSIMGNRGNTFKKKIEGYNGAIFEVKGFCYEEKISYILNFNISMKGNFERKGLGYEITAKHEEKKDQPLYKSEGIKGMKSKSFIEFNLSSILDIL